MSFQILLAYASTSTIYVPTGLGLRALFRVTSPGGHDTEYDVCADASSTRPPRESVLIYRVLSLRKILLFKHEFSQTIRFIFFVS